MNTMKLLVLTFIFMVSGVFINAQKKIYHPDADAKKDIENALKTASKENKHLIIQVGGNWCSWCLLFNNYIHENEEIAELVNDNYVYYHLNYSKENKNQDILDSYGNPEKKGFPVLLVLDSQGNLLHTQETGVLEEGKGYNFDKVHTFFQKWTFENYPLKVY